MQNSKCKIERQPGPRAPWPSFCILHFALFIALLVASPLQAAPVKERDPAEAEKLYHEIGSSMVCLCGGCREKLLECSMVNCGFAGTARQFLREECRDAERSQDQIRADMIARFGPEIVQVHGDSLLYPVLIAGALATLAVFGAALWYFALRGSTRPPLEARGSKPVSDPSLEARILREVEEIE